MQFHHSYGGRRLLNQISNKEVRFSCQQSGLCCCNPNIIVTLTYRDIYLLFSYLEENIEKLIQKISFYTLNESLDTKLQQQMVLTAIKTSEGLVVPGLRKFENGTCIFYKSPNCSIYQYRPTACCNYPFTFEEKGGKIVQTWVKRSLKSCPGIGKGIPWSRQSIQQLGSKFVNEIKTHNQLVKNINIEDLEGRPLSVREALWVLVIYGEKVHKQETE